MKSILMSHPTGNNFVNALLEELFKKKQLNKFVTTIGFCHDSIFKGLNRRIYNIPDKYIEKHIWAELFRLTKRSNLSYEERLASVDKVYESLDRQVSANLQKYKPHIIHCYEDCSYHTFKKGRDLGIICSYELPIAHWMTTRRLLSEEADRYPDWKSTLENRNESEEKLIRKERELELSSCITCPSEFVFNSIPQKIRQEKVCQISPFGSPKITKVIDKENIQKNSEIKVLFVGSMTQRKGLADIFAAMKLLSGLPVKLSILGKTAMPMDFYHKRCNKFNYYPPCSNSEVKKIMCHHDLLLLPSIVEGRALVQQEALSCGLPIIATSNAGGEDLIDEGQTGYLIPIRSPSKIAEKIELFLDNKIDRKERIEICQKKAVEYSWKNYSNKIISLISSLQE